MHCHLGLLSHETSSPWLHWWWGQEISKEGRSSQSGVCQISSDLSLLCLGRSVLMTSPGQSISQSTTQGSSKPLESARRLRCRPEPGQSHFRTPRRTLHGWFWSKALIPPSVTSRGHWTAGQSIPTGERSGSRRPHRQPGASEVARVRGGANEERGQRAEETQGTELFKELERPVAFPSALQSCTHSTPWCGEAARLHHVPRRKWSDTYSPLAGSGQELSPAP